MRLGHLGIQGLPARHFYTSALNTADFLSETHPSCTVFVIGEGGLLAALHERKIANDTIRPSYVVVGEGAASLEKLAQAHSCIERGARLLATNPDNWCPISAEETRPGAGATAAFLEARLRAPRLLPRQTQRLYVPSRLPKTLRFVRRRQA